MKIYALVRYSNDRAMGALRVYGCIYTEIPTIFMNFRFYVNVNMADNTRRSATHAFFSCKDIDLASKFVLRAQCKLYASAGEMDKGGEPTCCIFMITSAEVGFSAGLFAGGLVPSSQQNSWE